MIYKDHIFTGDEVRGREFIDSEFIRCRFISTNLRFTSFTNCIFQTSDLSSIIFDLTSFVKCSFPESKLSNLDFSEVQLKECNFTSVIMKNCILQQIKTGSNSEKKKFDLSHALFRNADLTGTIFFLCSLKAANFHKANLETAVFENCDLREANLIQAHIAGTTFVNSKIEKTLLDLEGFITFGNSKGFVLEQPKIS